MAYPRENKYISQSHQNDNYIKIVFLKLFLITQILNKTISQYKEIIYTIYTNPSTYKHNYIHKGGVTVILPLTSQGVAKKGLLSTFMSLMTMQGDETYHINTQLCYGNFMVYQIENIISK